jgi:hypothetical protein
LAFASRGSAVGESKVFCLFEGEGRVEGDGPEPDAVNFCGVGVFGVEGRDWYLGEEPPIEFLSAYIKAEEQGY